MNHIPISNRIIWSALELAEAAEQHAAASDDTEAYGWTYVLILDYHCCY